MVSSHSCPAGCALTYNTVASSQKVRDDKKLEELKTIYQTPGVAPSSEKSQFDIVATTSASVTRHYAAKKDFFSFSYTGKETFVTGWIVFLNK